LLLIRCEKCGEEDPEVLIVHHNDLDRRNNKLGNLVVLCANCHVKVHRGHRRTERLRKVELDKLPKVKATGIHIS
jgi:5-methylcytosine-specific restriction endonuclease McrA